MKKDRMLSDISEKLYQEEAEKENPKTVTTLFVMAPVLCGYVLWVLQEALRTGKKRLYFLARDGYSMYQAAQVICRELGLSLECRYLYCSRYAFRSAEYHLLGEESLSYICLGGIRVTFEKLMLRAGLTRQEAAEIAELLQFTDKMQMPLSYGEVKAMEPALSACMPFMEKMYAHARERYPFVCGYLRQEGLLEAVPYAVVDSGWTGSMQKSLKHLLESMGYLGEVEGYYFGMYEYPKDISGQPYHAWYFGPQEALRRKVYFSNSLFECIFSSPEGMTAGYEMKEGRFFPRLEKKHNPNREKIEKSTEYLKRYAKILTAEGSDLLLLPSTPIRNVAEELLYYFMGRPTVPEAREYGGYIFCDDVIGEREQRVAEELTYEELKENRLLYKSIHMLLKRGKPVHESAWIEGSTVLAERAGKGDLRQCALYKYVLYLRKMTK